MAKPGEDSLRLLDQLFARLPEGVVADARLSGGRWGTMRFANGRIHQPHLESYRVLSLRVSLDRRLATATTSDLTKSGLDRLLKEAKGLASVAPVDRHFAGFPPEGDRLKPVEYSEATAKLSPELQAKLADRAIDAAREAVPDARISGVVNVGAEFLAVANTSGLSRYARRSVAQSSVLVERPQHDPPVSGWSEGADWRADRLDTAALGKEAAGRVARSAPASMKPGKYRVLLGGAAVSELLSFLGYLGFNGHGEEEGWSCLGTRRGRAIAPKELSLVDDGRSSQSLPQAMDYEGLEKRRTPLIDHGVAQPAVVDLVTGGRLGRPPTGHGVPPESPYGEWGPIPTQLLLLGGDAREEELIKETGNGILVTRFHYVRVVHPARSILTGMTRDGTYRIRDGEIVEPVRNLRFTESILNAVKHAELWGRDDRRYSDERGFATVTTPPLLTSEFRFTSATLF